MIVGLLLALALGRAAWVARRWQRAREAEAAERAIAWHTLLIYATLPDGRDANRYAEGRY